jgi:hypothetical protein
MTRTDARMRRWWAGSLAAVALLAAVGCGGGTATVGGVVTLDGKPLEGAVVTFSPTGGDPNGGVGGSSGRTDAEGRYTLRTVIDDKPGAAVGKHRVVISKFGGTDPKNPEGGGKEMLPLKYSQNSELTFDVPAGGSDKANFDLKSK